MVSSVTEALTGLRALACASLDGEPAEACNSCAQAGLAQRNERRAARGNAQ